MKRASYMSVYKRILSNQPGMRIKRHALLGIASYLITVLAYPPNGSYGSLNGLKGDGFLKYYEMVVIRSAFYLLFVLLFFYIVSYFLMPLFFWKKKYLQFLLMSCILLIAISFFRYAIFLYVYNPIMKQLGLHVNSVHDILRMSIILNFDGPAFLSFALISVKFFKDWQQKQRDNFNLQKENSNAELQLLKAQIHPHFLFNTLNNIYSFTLNKSPLAKDILKRLEEILHYMIEECEQPLVPVKNEVKIIEDYFELERIRYGNSLDMQLEITGDYNNKLIAPLLMIPFVENSFKHGTSKILKEPWIKLFIQADKDVVHFSLTNSKPADEIINGKGGIGLNNVKKRLELLYPSNHLLTVESSVNTFTVNMQIPLQEVSEEGQYTTRKKMIIDDV